MRRHWWWRPGWRPGRRQYAWHLTFGDQTVSRGQADLRRVVADYQAHLAELPGLDPVPVEWLHLTVQGIGFADQVGADEVERIVAAVRRRCAALAPLRVTLGPAELQQEGVWLPVAPAATVRRLRAAVRAGIAEVWGAGRVPEPAGGFVPHVSLAHSNTDGPSEPYAAALAKIGPRSATVELGAIQVISLRRDTHLYRWEAGATVALAPTPNRPAPEAGPGGSGLSWGRLRGVRSAAVEVGLRLVPHVDAHHLAEPPAVQVAGLEVDATPAT
jgi:2'-5' RNA ligase